MNIFKKITSLIVFFAIIVSVSACQKQPALDMSSLKLEDYSAFAIVYPADYENYQLEDVALLQKTIEKVTGKKPYAIPDTEPERENEIVLAGTSRKTGLDETINAFQSELDYIISLDGNDIVLGGQSYYADMKAIYDFINNYLGYNDLDDTVSKATSTLSEAKTVLYSEPSYDIMTTNPGKYPFLEAKDAKTMADAGFNLVQLDVSKLDLDAFKLYSKWCARFNIRILQKGIYNIKTEEFNINDVEFTTANPLIFGHYVQYAYDLDNLEFYEELCTAYKEKYSQYGWKLVMHINSIPGSTGYTYDSLLENSDVLKNADIISIASYLSGSANENDRGERELEELVRLSDIAHKNGLELWFTVDDTVRQPSSTESTYTSYYRWRSYLGLTLGASGVEYMEFRRSNVVTDNFEPTGQYEEIAKINNELLLMGDAYSEYEFLGVFAAKEDEYDVFSTIDPSLFYTDFDAITSFTTPANTVLFGYFASKDGSKKAFVALDTTLLEKTSALSIASTFTFTGNKVTYYKDGVATLSEPASGTYRIRISNGSGVFITIE